MESGQSLICKRILIYEFLKRIRKNKTVQVMHLKYLWQGGVIRVMV